MLQRRKALAAPRTHDGSPWPRDFVQLIPVDNGSSEDAVLRKKELVRLGHELAKRQNVNLDKVAAILMGACFHAQQERIVQRALNRSDWNQRTAFIHTTLVNLAKALAGLRDVLEPAARLAALRRRTPVFEYGEDGSLTVTKSEAHFSKNSRVPNAFAELYAALAEILAPINRHLARTRGHQAQPWIAEAFRALRAAGVQKRQADELLRAAGLKGAEAGRAARQTIPIR